MLGEYIGAGSGTTKLLLHLSGNSTDSSGNGNSGTDTAITYSLANGKLGQGAGFNGSSSKITTPIDSIDNGARTYSFWLKTSSNQADSATILWYSTANVLTDQFSVRILGNDSGSHGLLRVFGRGTTGENWYRDSVLALNDGIYRNIVVVIDVSADTIDIYVNGSLNQGSLTGTSSSIGSSGTLSIGHNAGDNTYYPMNLDELIIENRAWTASEIKKYYTNSLGRF